MARYRAIDNETGDEVAFEWHDIHPPTDADLEEVFAEHRAQKVRTKTPRELFPEGAPPGELNVNAFQLPPGSGEMLGAIVPAGVAGMINPALGIGTLGALSFGGAGLGNLAEQGIERLTTGRPIEPLESVAAGTRGLAGEVAGGVIGSALKVGPEGMAGLKLAREAGLPTSAARYTQGWIPRTLQTIADWTPAGRAIESAYRSKLVGQVTQWRTDLVRKMMGLPVKEKAEIGLEIGETIKSMRDADVIYGQFGETLNGLENVPLPNTVQWIKDRGGMKIASDMGWGPSTAEYKNLKRILVNEGGVTGKDVSFALSKIWRRFSKDAPYQVGLKEELKTTLIKDLDAFETSTNVTLGELKRQADEAWKNASEWLKATPAAREVVRKLPSGTPYFEAFPGNIVDSLFKPEKANDLLKIKQVLIDGGKQEVWDAAVAQRIEGMLNRATSVDKVTGESTFMPAAFVEEYGQIKPMLEKTAPEIMSKLDEFAEVAKGAAPEFKAKAKGTPWLTFMGLQSAAAYKLGPEMGVAVPNGFGALAAWGLMGTDKAARFIQKWGIQAGAATAKGLALPTKAGTIRGLQELTSEE